MRENYSIKLIYYIDASKPDDTNARLDNYQICVPYGTVLILGRSIKAVHPRGPLFSMREKEDTVKRMT